MTRTDWLAGVRHAWALDRGRLGALLAYQALIAAVTVIAGAAMWLPVAAVGAFVVPLTVTVIDRAVKARDSREFYQWMFDNTDRSEWQSADVE